MEIQLTFRIPAALGRELARRARERSVPRSIVVREALSAYLAAPEPSEAVGAGRVWERVKGYAGSLPLDHQAIEADAIARAMRRHNWRE